MTEEQEIAAFAEAKLIASFTLAAYDKVIVLPDGTATNSRFSVDGDHKIIEEMIFFLMSHDKGAAVIFLRAVARFMKRAK